MTGENTRTSVGPLPETTRDSAFVPRVLTRLVWALWAVSLGILGWRLWAGESWRLAGLFAVDGLTTVLWVVVTFFSGIVTSYSRRYMARSNQENRFFTRVFGFTLVVMTLAAADHLAVFLAAWLAMGLVMADLIGTIEGWPQAQAAARIARRYFLGSTTLLAIGVSALWWETGQTTVSGLVGAVASIPSSTLYLAAGALVLAAMVQSALVPFHTWLLSSMTAPTPASALMHAGFVNAGGILLTRFAPVVAFDSTVLLAIVVVGATSALLGKLLKTVQTDVKRRLGCSTVGQMGFMIMQVGLGFFAAAITHLILHGFYKAYQFLSAGGQVEQTSPTAASHQDGSWTVPGVVVTALTAIAGGAVFALLTGKGTDLDSGLLLTLFVVMMTLHASREAVQSAAIPTAVRYGAVPLVFLPAIAVYAVTYQAIKTVLAGLPMVSVPTALTPVHWLVAIGFVVAYIAIEAGWYRQSKRLYVALLNATQPPSGTVLTSTEEYNEY